MEVKELIAGIKKAHADFIVANELAMKEKVDKGFVTAELDARVEKINAAIDTATDKLDARLDEIEKKANRIELIGSGVEGATEKDLAMHLAAFGKYPGFGTPGAAAPTAEQFVGYGKAMDAYLRKGDRAISQDMLAELSVGSDPEGGYWVKPDTSGRIIKFVFESSPMRQLANVMTIGTDALEGLRDLDEASSIGTPRPSA